MNELIWYRARHRRFGSQWLYFQHGENISQARRVACELCGISALFEPVKEMPKLKYGGEAKQVKVYYEDVMQEAR